MDWSILINWTADEKLSTTDITREVNQVRHAQWLDNHLVLMFNKNNWI